MILIYKQIKKRNERKRLEAAALNHAGNTPNVEDQVVPAREPNVSIPIDAIPVEHAEATPPHAVAVHDVPVERTQDEPTPFEMNDLNEQKEQEIVNPEMVAEKKRRRIYRWKIILGLFSPFCLQALDTTIVASALPYIAQDFSMPSIPLLPSTTYLVQLHKIRVTQLTTS